MALILTDKFKKDVMRRVAELSKDEKLKIEMEADMLGLKTKEDYKKYIEEARLFGMAQDLFIKRQKALNT